MPQELQVLTCYQCETFQVQIVKKVPKWQCKMCGEKQSVKKVYYVGKGKECREIVQELNTKRIQLEEKHSLHLMTSDGDHLSEQSQLKEESGDSKWNTFLPETEDKGHTGESELENYTFERKSVKRKKPVKRKQAYSYQEDSSMEMHCSKQAKNVVYKNDVESDIENNCRINVKGGICGSKPTEAKLSKWNEDNDDLHKVDTDAKNETTDWFPVHEFEGEHVNNLRNTNFGKFGNSPLKCNDLITLCTQNPKVTSELGKHGNEIQSAGCSPFGQKVEKDQKFVNIFDDDDGDLDLNI